MTKFKVGDIVRVVNYGHLIWDINASNDGIIDVDINPEIVGRRGIIVKAYTTQGNDRYAIELDLINGSRGKYAWYDNEQLELI